MDLSKYSAVDEFDTVIGDSTLYYSMAENEETFIEKTTEEVSTVFKRRPSNATPPAQVANKNILQKLKRLSSTPIQSPIRGTKVHNKNGNLPNDEKRKSWTNKDQEKASECTLSEGDEADDKTIENKSLINTILANTTEGAAKDNDDKENKPDIRRERRKSQIPTIHKTKVLPHICIFPGLTTDDNKPLMQTPAKLPRVHTRRASDFEFPKNLPEISFRRSLSVRKAKTPNSARIAIYSFALRKVTLTRPNTSRKSFLSPNIIAASGKRRRLSVGKPAAAAVTSNSCKYCFKQFKIAKALSNHLLEYCSKIPPAERRRLAIDNVDKIKASKKCPFH